MSLPLQKENLYVLPILHYTMEYALFCREIFHALKPDCVAVELPLEHEEAFLHAASRLPDISVISAGSRYFLAEPCDPSFEALRSALENGLPAHCIDADAEEYPYISENLPDTYATTIIGHEAYYKAYRDTLPKREILALDTERELFMAKKLKELSLRYDKVLFISGFFHAERILSYFERTAFPQDPPRRTSSAEVATLTEESYRQNMAEYGYLTLQYELSRKDFLTPAPNRQSILLNLYKEAGARYTQEYGLPFPQYHLRNLMKFSRNYALQCGRLTPNLFMLVQAAKGCVDHNYAYEVWKIATDYPHYKNIDNLKELPLTVDELWGNSKKIHFNLKQKQHKGLPSSKRKKDATPFKFEPPSGPFSICSYPPEDIAVENLGAYLKKKSMQLLSDEATRVSPFLASLEDGIDVRETIRHLYKKTLFVKTLGKAKGALGSVCVIFDEDKDDQQFPWLTTWIGEHNQESDMAFYATPMHQNVVGPGISRCQYGGFLLSYPPGRLFDVWTDPDYFHHASKAEVLLHAAIDYSLLPGIVYVAKTPPKSRFKCYAARYGKKLVYHPIGSLPKILNKIRNFHVLEGKERREIAGDYIFD